VFLILNFIVYELGLFYCNTVLRPLVNAAHSRQLVKLKRIYSVYQSDY